MKRLQRATRFSCFYLIVVLVSCSKGKGDGSIDTQEPPPGEAFSVKSKTEVFGFIGEQRYSYCPTLVKEDNGAVHMFFCGTQNMIMVDNIYHVKINADGSKTPAKIVLTPGTSGAFDDHHTCDPSVIKGDFGMGGNRYQYALFYLTNKYGVYYNEIGVAFSNSLDGDTWVKYPQPLVKKTWDYEGDQAIGANKAWGVGQPSAISLDKKGKVLLTYTIGDINGTRIVWSEINMSDMSSYTPVAPTNMVNSGLVKIDLSGTDVTNNADFAIDRANNKIVIVRPVHPNLSNTYPTHIEDMVEADQMPLDDFLASRGKWTSIIRVGSTVSGYPRNHNPGIERDAYGEITDWKKPVIYYTVSLAAPNVEPTGAKFAEWTYHIWKAVVGVD